MVEHRDLVRLEGRLLTFLRRADRLVKVLGELVDPDAVQDVLRRSVPRLSWRRFRIHVPEWNWSPAAPSAAPWSRPAASGMRRPQAPAHPRRHGNAHPPHGHGKLG
ncbi:MAG: hypothetical protein ACLT38_09125 [Akkermansia sp.]